MLIICVPFVKYNIPGLNDPSTTPIDQVVSLVVQNVADESALEDLGVQLSVLGL